MMQSTLRTKDVSIVKARTSKQTPAYLTEWRQSTTFYKLNNVITCAVSLIDIALPPDCNELYEIHREKNKRERGIEGRSIFVSSQSTFPVFHERNVYARNSEGLGITVGMRCLPVHRTNDRVLFPHLILALPSSMACWAGQLESLLHCSLNGPIISIVLGDLDVFLRFMAMKVPGSTHFR